MTSLRSELFQHPRPKSFYICNDFSPYFIPRIKRNKGKFSESSNKTSFAVWAVGWVADERQIEMNVSVKMNFCSPSSCWKWFFSHHFHFHVHTDRLWRSMLECVGVFPFNEKHFLIKYLQMCSFLVKLFLAPLRSVFALRRSFETCDIEKSIQYSFQPAAREPLCWW